MFKYIEYLANGWINHSHGNLANLLLGKGYQGGRSHWAVYYTSPKRFIITVSYSLAYQLWGLLLNFDLLVYQVECPNVSTINYNLQNG